MPEANDVSQQPDNSAENPSRRTILRGGAALAGVSAATALAGFRFPELLSNTDPTIRLIFGNHDLPDGYGGDLNEVARPYLHKGDLEVSLWPKGPVEIIDQGMRRAKKVN